MGNDLLRHDSTDDPTKWFFLGRSLAMQQVAQLIRLASTYSTAVLITGATGTGKERVARAIHDGSQRRGGPFIAVNCGGLPAALEESELFGRCRGAFTGAIDDRPGLLRAASGGTLFLDEIGEAPASVQVKLLRALETKEVVPVGSSVPEPIDTRVVSATHRNLEADVLRGSFRADLYYRINTLPIHLPSLSQRRVDFPELVQSLSSTIDRELVLTDRAIETLRAYSWPGNWRELQNELERAANLAGRAKRIDVAHLSAKIRELTESPTVRPRPVGLRQARREFEREYIRAAMVRHGGNASEAAVALGLSRSMLQRKLRAYGWLRR